MREATLEKALCDYARKKGYLVYKFTSPQHRGVPDRQFVSPTGIVAFAEIKAPGKKPSALQEREMNLLRNRGVRVEWFDCLDNAKRWLDCILDEV